MVSRPFTMASKAAAGILLLLAAAAATAASLPMPSRSSSSSMGPRAIKRSSKLSKFPSMSSSAGRAGGRRSATEEPEPPTPAAPAPSTCVRSLLDLSPCLAFFKDAGATTAPPGCCAGLQSIVGAQPACLCHIVNHTLERAIGVDIPVDRAFALLQDICRLPLPPEVINSCGDKGEVPPLYACPVPSVLRSDDDERRNFSRKDGV